MKTAIIAPARPYITTNQGHRFEVPRGLQKQAIQGKKDEQNKDAQPPLEALQLIQTHAVKAIPCSLHDVVMDSLGLRIDIPPLCPQLRGHLS
jgi:hypothetical protein